MVTVIRADGLRCIIYTDDHPPAHVHVFGDGQTKINLIGPTGGPELVFAHGASKAEVRRAMRLVEARQADLVRHWERIHERSVRQ